MPVEIRDIGVIRDRPAGDGSSGHASGPHEGGTPHSSELATLVAGNSWFGVYPGLVVDLHDPEGQGQVAVTLPWATASDGKGLLLRARLAMPMAGDRRGTWFPPEVGDEVLLAFEGGDLRRPYVIGALWNGADRPPVTPGPPGAAATRVIRSPRGLELALVDTQGQERLTLLTPGGQSLSLQDQGSCVEIAAAGGTRIRLNPKGVEISAPGEVSVTGATVNVNAAQVKLNAAMTTASGVLKCESLIATTVVAQSYTNGAGNVW